MPNVEHVPQTTSRFSDAWKIVRSIRLRRRRFNEQTLGDKRNGAGDAATGNERMKRENRVRKPDAITISFVGVAK
jgi:hypothetical protein